MTRDDWNAGEAMDQAFIDRTITVAVIVVGAFVLASVMVVAWVVAP